MKTETAISIVILKCPSCGAGLEEPGLCVYCGNKLNIEGLTKDERLRDLEMERQIFQKLREQGETIGIEVALAIEPSDDLCFAYFAKKMGADKKSMRKVGNLGYTRVGNGVEYRIVAMTKNEAAHCTHWLRVRSFGIPDNTRLYECSNDMVDFLAATIDIEDIRGHARNPIWLLLVQMLNNIDPEASKKLKKIVVEYEKGQKPTDEEVKNEKETVFWAALEGLRQAVQKGATFTATFDPGHYEFGADLTEIEEVIQIVRRVSERCDAFLAAISGLGTASLKLADGCQEIQAEVATFIPWLLAVKKKRWFGTHENSYELVERFDRIRAIFSRIRQLVEEEK